MKARAGYAPTIAIFAAVFLLIQVSEGSLEKFFVTNGVGPIDLGRHQDSDKSL